MSQLLIADVAESLLERLRQRASRHGRTAEAEARAILAAALQGPPGPWDRINAFREQLATSGRTFSDSTELLREDRER
jgi:plasmid stability protein